jgi:hypothetical protein
MERLIVWQRWCPPPEPSPEAVAQANLWRIQARGRMTGLGADVISELGGTIVSSCSPDDLSTVIEACLSLARDVEQEEDLEVGSVAQAITLGSVERAHPQGPWVGDALDRAQALANYGDAGDVVLDQATQTRSAQTYLFSGELRAGTNISGALLDRDYPHRARCGDALARLSSPSLPATAQIQFDAFRRLANTLGRQRVVLVAPYGSGATAWLTRIDADVRPSAWLNIRGLGAGFAPLSGLRYALSRLTGSAAIDTVLGSDEEPDRQALAVLSAIRDGGVARRRDATMALRQYVGRCWETTGRRAFVSVNPVALIDPATLSVVAEVAREGGPDCFVVMRVLPDAKPPEAFVRAGGFAEVRVPGLPQPDARSLAQSLLGKSTAIEIARRAAAMGGATVLGVAEAVRVLVSSGDIVPSESGFRWRRGPSARTQATNVEALIEERVDELDDDTRGVLEILAWVPDPGERTLVSDVAAVDGVALPALERAIEELALKAFVEHRNGDVWLSHTVRRVVLETMSPARGPDLSLRVAGALSRLCGERSLFARADVAFYLARGGRPQSAVDTLLEAAMAAAQHGFVRSGVRLAAAAVECNPSVETRRKAAAIAEGLGRSVVSPAAGGAGPQAKTTEERLSHESVQLNPEKLAEQAVQQALRGIRNRDFDSADRALELMVAAGRDGAHVDRIRGLLRLEKGDRIGAVQLFARAGSREHTRDGPRARLTRALVAFHDNDLQGAVREALGALALTRARGDALGETATLRALSAFYYALGRKTEANELSELARTRLPEPAVSGSSAQ